MMARFGNTYRNIIGNWKSLRGIYGRVVGVCALIIIWTTVLLTGPQTEYGLEVWLDSTQSQVLGLNIPVYLISNGKPSALLTRKEGGELLSPVNQFKLSRDVDFLNLTWRAPKGYRYSVEELSSSDHALMPAPTTNIPSFGSISSQPSVLRIRFPCSGDTSGRGFARVVISLTDDRRKPTKLLFLVEKECRKRCHPKCQNGGQCDDWGVCQCPEGYYGPFCGQVFCNPKCYNGGTCFTPDSCICTDGFTGEYCQKGLCRENCRGRGACIGIERCVCRKGWRGKDCSIPNINR